MVNLFGPIVFQTIGGAIFVSAAQSAFSNRFIKALATHAPSLNPYETISVGATDLRKVYQGEILAGVVDSYMDGIKIAFIVSVVLAGVSVLCSMTIPWVSVKGKLKEVSVG